MEDFPGLVRKAHADEPGLRGRLQGEEENVLHHARCLRCGQGPNSDVQGLGVYAKCSAQTKPCRRKSTSGSG